MMRARKSTKYTMKYRKPLKKEIVIFSRTKWIDSLSIQVEVNSLSALPLTSFMDIRKLNLHIPMVFRSGAFTTEPHRLHY